jgi:UDPglucose 6-dehydrogenase
MENVSTTGGSVMRPGKDLEMPAPSTSTAHTTGWRVGLVGLGKLGMPVALAMSLKGHEVMGYDVDAGRMQKQRFPHRERGPNGEPSIESLIRQSDLRFGSLGEVVRHAEILFVAVQTPHDPLYEGVTRLPQDRVDFDYRFLRKAVEDLSSAILQQGEDKIVIVISTVLPGTVRREILPRINRHVKLCYNPFFIAMGTTIDDFINPEFVLLGVTDEDAAAKAQQFYRTLHNRPVFQTSIENAELIKVAYNTFISMKIAYANTLMEICHKTPGCHVDEVSNALSLATGRLLSPRYLRGGMGDGGGCHPRDNIALSWLARRLNLSYDFFDHLMACREKQTEWLADLIEQHHVGRGFAHRRVGLYGRAFKAGTNLTIGSPATLLANILRERGFDVRMYDPYVDEGACPFDWPGVYFVSTHHVEFASPEWSFPAGSVIIDPFRYLPPRDDVAIIPVGVNTTAPAE